MNAQNQASNRGPRPVSAAPTVANSFNAQTAGSTDIRPANQGVCSNPMQHAATQNARLTSPWLSYHHQSGNHIPPMVGYSTASQFQPSGQMMPNMGLTTPYQNYLMSQQRTQMAQRQMLQNYQRYLEPSLADTAFLAGPSNTSGPPGVHQTSTHQISANQNSTSYSTPPRHGLPGDVVEGLLSEMQGELGHLKQDMDTLKRKVSEPDDQQGDTRQSKYAKKVTMERNNEIEKLRKGLDRRDRQVHKIRQLVLQLKEQDTAATSLDESQRVDGAAEGSGQSNDLIEKILEALEDPVDTVD